MKLHYALAALAVAAMSFSASAAVGDDLFGGNAVPKGCQKTPYEQGWRSSAHTNSQDFVTNGGAGKLGYRSANLSTNGYEDGVTVFNITKLNEKFAFPVTPTAMKVYELRGHLWRRNGGDTNITYNFYFADNIDAENPVSKASFTFNQNNKAIVLDGYKLRLYTTEALDNAYFVWEATNTTNWQEGGLVSDVKLVEVGDVASVNYVTNNGTQVAPAYFVNGENYVINSLPNVAPAPGYYFEGWCTDEACSEKVVLPMTVTSNTTLYAKMTEKPVSDNYMNMWDGLGKGSADLASDFGWTATPNVSWSEPITDYNAINGYRENVKPNGYDQEIRAILTNQINTVYSYPVVKLTEGFYKFSVNAGYYNHPSSQTFDINSKADGSGDSYGKVTVNTPKWNGDGTPAQFDVEIPAGVETAYMCWSISVSGDKDRAISWDYSLIKVEDSEVYAEKKAEAEVLLADDVYENVTGREKTDLETLISVEPTDYVQAIKALNEAIDAFKAAAPAYDAWEANKSAAKSILGNDVAANVQEILNTVPTTADEATEASSRLAEPVKTAYINKVAGEGTDVELADWTKEGVQQKFDVKTDQLANKVTDSWFTNYYDASYNWNNSGNKYDWDCHWYQEIDLEPGTYTFAVFARAANYSDQDFFIYVNDEGNKVDLPMVGDQDHVLGRGWDYVGLQFTVTAPAESSKTRAASAKTKLGLKFATRQSDKSWVSFADFKLRKNNNTTVGVEVVEAEENAPAVYYNLNGVRVDGNDLTPGVYVVRRGAKAEKILVK